MRRGLLAGVGVACWVLACDAVRLDEDEAVTLHNASDDSNSTGEAKPCQKKQPVPDVPGVQKNDEISAFDCVGTYVTSCDEIVKRTKPNLWQRGCDHFYESQKLPGRPPLYWQCQSNTPNDANQRGTMAWKDYSDRIDDVYAGSQAMGEEGCKSTKWEAHMGVSADIKPHPCYTTEVKAGWPLKP
eukprot:TRINITY_DN91965_c0_g1_i1.p2 TRINITY_DN91965_c0_g1~~TRINITY_DN91965_c0_g1_i1.p2  ORF type:complete len:185 (-),score=35.82 TRINITY_DN91965_c0_g1_i1:168-722(-)